MISNVSQISSNPAAANSSQASTSTSSVQTQNFVAQGVMPGGAGGGGVVSSTNPSNTQGAGSKDLAAAVEQLNAKVQNLNRNLEFSINQDNGEVLVKVVDANTHQLVRQIPSEEALALAQNIDQYLQEHHVGLVKAKA